VKLEKPDKNYSTKAKESIAEYRSQEMNTNVITQTELDSGSIEELVNKLIPPDELEPSSIDEVVKLPSFFGKMQECERLCQTTYSEIDHSIQNALVWRRLQQMTNTLMLNPLWKERIEESGIKAAPRNFEEWQQLPLSDKTVMSDFFMGSRPGLVVPLSYGGFEIVASGGTSSGSPAEMVYSLRELHDTYKIAGKFIGEYMLRDYLEGDDPKWVATTLADFQMWSSGTMVGGVLQHIPGINYIGAGPLMKDVYQHMMCYKGPKAIMAISAGIAILSDLGIGLHEEARKSFRVAMYGSGLLPHRKQMELKEIYPNVEILSYFATVQNEAIGLQLKAESPLLAAVPGLHLIEIVDEEGRWVAEGEEGELVATRLHGHEAPFLRFKSGDRVKRHPDIDGPGLKTKQFEFLGRSGDVIHLGDTQFPAPVVYTSLCRELKAAGVFDLQGLAHEIQFVNYRTAKKLHLMVSVDDVRDLFLKMENQLGVEGVKRLFVQSLSSSLSIFNQGEANAYYIEKTGYSFDIKLVKKWSDEIYRTQFGKVPVIRDIF
jgi:phenylacetate-CoA ligase